ncbi:MAG: COX15/CtaA family protein, partial [Ketobacter sp.]
MWLKRLTLLAVLLACGVVALGAYTRLQDAGLGCPDWPGCYGKLVVPQSEHAISAANEAFPHRPLESHKAWPEMIHRYFA